MESERLKNWLDYTKRYAADSFWKEVFNQSSNPFSKEGEIGKNLASGAMDTRLRDPFPRCDLFEKDGNLCVEAELPGMHPEEVMVVLRGQELTLKGVISTLEPKIRYFIKERPDRPFEKIISLPFKVDKNKVSSGFENGLLTVTMPIIPEEDAVPVHIEFQGQRHNGQETQL
ncbi:Hsp20/alpha crystallin family protein [Bacillus sp. FJAT-27251]|uniref:Hsp20/alpha crystallin family protein n=1 Tax=Bacillus sp. FJAT-27251 TaxID=1684142 RepID=UPI0006A7DAF2|nr:Hsp20/alpha crystallin family protein [Bacillus sp. FJAT-27251]